LQPLQAISGSAKTGKKSTLGRHILVLLQFTISIAVIASALLMNSQMQYIYSMPLGFDKENKITLRMRGADAIEQLPAFKNTLLQNPHVLGMTYGSVPGIGQAGINAGPVENNDGSQETRVFNVYRAGEDYLDVMGMELVAGRSFERGMPADLDNALLVNETAVNNLGWDEPLGKLVFGRPVIGVVRDFNIHDLSRELEPIAIIPRVLDYSESSPANRANATVDVILDVSGESIRDTIEFLQDQYALVDPVHPFQFQFLDERLNEMYFSEQRQMSLIGVFSAICILISCLGLLGLTAYTTEQRARELAIRKVLGASATQLTVMLFKSVLLIVLGASLLASITSFWAVTQWLQGFAYRADLNYFSFALASIVCIVIAFTTMTLQSWRTSGSNPAEVLKYE